MKKLKLIQGQNIDLVFEEFTPAQPEKKFVPCISYHITLHDSQYIVGHCSAKLGFNEQIFFIGNIGYEINEDYRGKGFAGEAVKLLLNLFKENGFDKIYITNLPDNTASRRVCEKLDAKFLGTFEIPADNIRRIQFNDKFMNIYELQIK